MNNDKVNITIISSLNKRPDSKNRIEVQQDINQTIKELLKDAAETFQIEYDESYRISLTRHDSSSSESDSPEVPGTLEIDTSNLDTKVEEWELEDGDVLLIDKKELKAAGYADSGPVSGKIYVANATDDPWWVEIYPNQDRPVGKEGSTIDLTSPKVPTGIGSVSLGRIKNKSDGVDYSLTDIEKCEGSKQIRPHRIEKFSYNNFMKGDPLPVKVLIKQKGKDDGDTGFKLVQHKHGVIITDECEYIDCKRNKFTGRVKHWQPMMAPRHNKDLTYDPHKKVTKGQRCDVCKQ